MHHKIATNEKQAENCGGGHPPSQDEILKWLGYSTSTTFKERLEKMTKNRTTPYQTAEPIAKKQKPTNNTENCKNVNTGENMDTTPPSTAKTNYNGPTEQSQPPPESTSYNVPTENRFGMLRSDENNLEDDKKKITKMPPIIVTAQIADFQAFHISIHQIAKGKYSIRYFKKSINIYTTTKEDFQNIYSELKQNNVESYTFTPKDEQTNKFVLKAAPGIGVNTIKRKLEENNIQITNCVQMTSKKTGQPSHSYLIYTDKSNKIKSLRNITDISNIKTKWEHFVRTNKTTQCFNCQRFGHGSSNCNYQPRCVKCIGNHLTKNCPVKKTSNSTVQCCNCKGPHTANYKGCPVRISFDEKRNNTTPKKHSNTNTNTNFLHVDNDFPQLTNNHNHNTPPTLQQNHRNYAQATKATTSNSVDSTNQINEFNKLVDELNELNSICNISYLINLVRNLKTELLKCNNDLQRLSVMQNLISNDPNQ